MSHLNGAFMKFIGVCETLGGLGLVLPELTRIHAELTPIAASLLVIVMIGAVVCSVALISIPAAILPLIVGILAATVARQRWYLVHSFA
jgi:hypothetical protein